METQASEGPESGDLSTLTSESETKGVGGSGNRKSSGRSGRSRPREWEAHGVGGLGKWEAQRLKGSGSERSMEEEETKKAEGQRVGVPPSGGTE